MKYSTVFFKPSDIITVGCQPKTFFALEIFKKLLNNSPFLLGLNTGFFIKKENKKMKKNIVLAAALVLTLSFYCGSLQARDKFSNEPMVEEQTIHELCQYASFSEVKDALIAGENVNGKDEQGRTPLMAACQGNSSFEMMQLLFSYGAKANLTDKKGRTAIMYAAQYDKYERVFRELLKAGADVNAKANDGTTALMLACENNSPKIVSLLIAAGADVNAKDYDGYHALDYVANNTENAAEIKRILASAGAKKR